MNHRLTLPTVSLAILGLALAAPTVALTPAPGQKTPVKTSVPKIVSYQKHIRPLFTKYCTGCHGDRRSMAKLNLNTIEGIKKGSESGKIYVPYRSKSSLVMRHLNGEKDYDQMPPAGKLKKDQIATVARWIDQGAKFDKAK